MYKAGVKKYGKAGMKAIQSAAGKGEVQKKLVLSKTSTIRKK